MDNREEFLFWRLAHHLITEQGYRILQLFKNQKELWLEKVENKNTPIIRLLRHDLDWSNWMQRDIELTFANGEKIRKKISRRSLSVLNIYVSAFSPVDDYEFRINEPFKNDSGKTSVESVLLFRKEILTGLERISSRVGHEIAFPIEDGYSIQDVETVKHAALSDAASKAKVEKAIFQSGKPFFTYLIIFIQILIFGLLELNGGSTNTSTLIKYGAKFNPLIIEGQWWRFITPIFLHIGYLHLAMNTLALYYLGITVEKIYGNMRFLFIYLFAGLTGTLASFLFSPNLSAGASGAIFGCFGALLYFSLIYPRLFFRTMGINVFVILAINLAFGFTVPGIDNAGHIGGLAGGFLATGIVHFPKKRKILLQFLFLLLSVTIVGASLSYGFSGKANVQGEKSVLILAQEYIKQEEYDQAYKTLSSFIAEQKDASAQSYFLLSFAEIKKGKLLEAKNHLLQAVRKDPEFHEAHFNLALIFLEENNLVQAKKYAERATEIQPSHKEYLNLLEEINTLIESSGEGS